MIAVMMFDDWYCHFDDNFEAKR